MKYYKLLSFLFFAFAICSDAQETISLQDSTFFNKKSEVYQKWLDDSGIGHLEVEKWKVKRNQFRLQLQFNYASKDSAHYAWESLNKSFYEKTGLKLEVRLFSKMIHLFEVESESARINIRNTPVFGEMPQVDGQIIYDKKSQDILLKGFLNRAEGLDSIFIHSFEINEKYLEVDTFNFKHLIKDKQRLNIYKVLFEEATTYFKSEHPNAIIKRISRSPLVFVVKNLKSEVVGPAKFAIFNPHELLLFTISFIELPDGVFLTCVVDGKYGSGLFKPRSPRGYREMDPEFAEELKEYVRFFTNENIPQWFK